MSNSPAPVAPNASASAEIVAQKAALEKKIAGLAQYQFFCWFPVWIPFVTNAVNPTPVMPGREIYVVWFHIGSLVFSMVSWIGLRIYLGKLKKQVAALDAQIAPPSSQTKPPIASPF